MNPREIEDHIADIETRLSGIEAHLLRQVAQAPTAGRSRLRLLA